MKPRIFLSHSKKDREFVEQLARDLLPARIEAWYDDWEIPPGASLRAKIFEEGIPRCDLFLVYLTGHSAHSKWVAEELDAAFVRNFKSEGGSLALYVDSDATRAKLRLDLQSHRIPVLEPANYSQCLLEIAALAWETYTDRRRQGTVRVFKDRLELREQSSFGDLIAKAKTFEMISLSANVITSFEDHFRAIIKDGANVKLILFDPGSETELYYTDLTRNIQEGAAIKEDESQLFIKKVAVWKEQIATGNYSGTVELRWLSGTSLYYNMWLKDRGLPSAIANLSVYFYGGRAATPVFQADTLATGFINAMGLEFQHVWSKAKRAPSLPRRQV
jgi:hypothetical protein